MTPLSLFGFALTIGIFASGYMFAFHMGGMILGGLCSLALGFVVMIIEHGPVSGFRFDDGITVRQLRDATANLHPNLRVFVAGPELYPAETIFTARLDGEAVMVIERKEDA